MILLSIRDIIEQFAQKYALNTWDWVALTIALITLIVSSISLAVSRKTLKSQKQTEKNTSPIITKSVQFLLIKMLCTDLINQLYYMMALLFLLEKTNYKTIPSHQFWEHLPEPNKYLHEMLFYNDEEKYVNFKVFSQKIQSFCDLTQHLKELANNGGIDIVRQELPHACKWSYNFFNDLSLLLDECFNLNDEQIVEFLEILIPQEGFELKEYKDAQSVPRRITYDKSSLFEFNYVTLSYKEMMFLFDEIKKENSINSVINNFTESFTRTHNSCLFSYATRQDEESVKWFSGYNTRVNNYVMLQVSLIVMHTLYNNELFIYYLYKQMQNEHIEESINETNKEKPYRRLNTRSYCYLYDKT